MVGFVFQDNLLLPYLSAQSNVEAALLATGLARRERRGAAPSCWTRSASRIVPTTFPPSSPAGSDRRSRSPARWPTTRASLLADEPTGALDSVSGRRALDLLATTARATTG